VLNEATAVRDRGRSPWAIILVRLGHISVPWAYIAKPMAVALSSASQFSPLALDRAWEYFCVRAGIDQV
jgi:hypothetical protein